MKKKTKTKNDDKFDIMEHKNDDKFDIMEHENKKKTKTNSISWSTKT